MTFEYRICNSEFDNEIFTSDLIDIVSVGSEGCMYQIPDLEKIIEIRKKAEQYGKNFSFVLPKTPQKFFDEAVKLIEKLNKEGNNYTLILNDYGLLYYCKENRLLPKNVNIGRGISRSFEDCLWYEHILRNETEFNKKTMLQNNMYDEDKKQFLDEFKVNGIECNMLKNQSLSYSNLKRIGYNISVDYRYVSVAFSRACQTARYKGRKCGECSILCDKPLNITMDKIWTRDTEMEANIQQINKKIKEFNPQFILSGNVLYRDNKKELTNMKLEFVDNLIFNSEFYKYSEVKEVLSHLKR